MQSFWVCKIISLSETQTIFGTHKNMKFDFKWKEVERNTEMRKTNVFFHPREETHQTQNLCPRFGCTFFCCNSQVVSFLTSQKWQENIAHLQQDGLIQWFLGEDETGTHLSWQEDRHEWEVINSQTSCLLRVEFFMLSLET
jgi:hypothetical protein